jgi:hypothetical protein
VVAIVTARESKNAASRKILNPEEQYIFVTELCASRVENGVARERHAIKRNDWVFVPSLDSVSSEFLKHSFPPARVPPEQKAERWDTRMKV